MSHSNPNTQALDQAIATFAAIRTPRLYGRHDNLFGTRRWWAFRRNYESLWPYADTWSALCTLVSLPGQIDAMNLLDGMVSGLKSYSRQPSVMEGEGDIGFESVVTPPLGGGGDRFFDDNAWLGLALVRHYELCGDPELLQLAATGFLFRGFRVVGRRRVADPWRNSLEGATSNRSRNTCVNGPASELGAKLYETTRESIFLDWAVRIYDWTRRALLTSDGLFADQIAPDGDADRGHLVLQPRIDDRGRCAPFPRNERTVLPQPFPRDCIGLPRRAERG